MTSIFILSFFIFYIPIVFINFIEDFLDEQELKQIGVNLKHS